MSFGKKFLEPLNVNKYGLVFEAVSFGENNTLWVSIANQEDNHTEMIRRLEPCIPQGYNNVLIPSESVDCFGYLPYNIKYLCV